MFTMLLFLMLSSIPQVLSMTDHEARISDLKCYSLPYGGVGFLSHIMTIYMIVMIWNQRSPWRFRQLAHKGIDITLSAICFLVTVGTGIANMARCNFHNSFTAVAFNELFLSACFSCLCWTAACWIGRENEAADVENVAAAATSEVITERSIESTETETKDDTTSHTFSNDRASEITAVEAPFPTAEVQWPRPKSSSDCFFWMVPYFIGATVTIAGLLRIVVHEIHNNRNMERITLVFGTLAAVYAVFAVVIIIGGVKADNSPRWALFGLFILMALGLTTMGVGILGPLYTDWVLASLEGNWAGVQSATSGAALYWVYFMARLLPFFCF